MTEIEIGEEVRRNGCMSRKRVRCDGVLKLAYFKMIISTPLEAL